MVQVHYDAEALSLAAARLFVDEARRAVEKRGAFDVLLSGGETPRRCYELLGQEPLRGEVPWHAVHLFWGDERWVPHNDPRSNFGMARRAFIERVPLAGCQVHPVPFGKTPQESAHLYEERLREHFAPAQPRFDLVLLGLGEDGHTASLFPGSPALEEAEHLVCAVAPASQPLQRVTVTPLLLNRSALVAFLVSGSGKAAILRRVLEGERDPLRLPAQAVRPAGKLVWLADRDAAALLSERSFRDPADSPR
ncbi:MAG TPA: 6-phosphogluconolactonase [Geomonas sp.]|nr:6-phosphogluconolactonase [Geomonas sp.]